MARIWRCKTCDGRKRGPEKPKLDATIRYCLECSSKSSRLVPRVCDALEKERAKRIESRKTKTKTAKEVQHRAAAKAQALKATKQEDRFWWANVDLRTLWSKMLLLPGVPDRVRQRNPSMKVRRCSRHPCCVGRAWWGTEFRIQVSVWEGAKLPNITHTMIHELAHLMAYVLYKDGGHGPGFKKAIKDLEDEWKERHPEHPCKDTP